MKYQIRRSGQSFIGFFGINHVVSIISIKDKVALVTDGYDTDLVMAKELINC